MLARWQDSKRFSGCFGAKLCRSVGWGPKLLENTKSWEYNYIPWMLQLLVEAEICAILAILPFLLVRWQDSKRFSACFGVEICRSVGWGPKLLENTKVENIIIFPGCYSFRWKQKYAKSNIFTNYLNEFHRTKQEDSKRFSGCLGVVLRRVVGWGPKLYFIMKKQ